MRNHHLNFEGNMDEDRADLEENDDSDELNSDS
jgi:hypothetical protein